MLGVRWLGAPVCKPQGRVETWASSASVTTPTKRPHEPKRPTHVDGLPPTHSPMPKISLSSNALSPTRIFCLSGRGAHSRLGCRPGGQDEAAAEACAVDRTTVA